MATSILSNPIFHNEQAAREHLERIRWPEGPYCSHCGATDKIYRLKVKRAKGREVLKCGHCKKQFSITTGTLFESSHVPLRVWLAAAYLMAASKKGISAHQLHRTLGVTYKTAWFMAHRIREAMADPVLVKLGGSGKVVEMDETYWGNKKHQRGTPGYNKKMKIFSLVERGGDVRSFHVSHVSGKTLKPIIREQVERDTVVMSDEQGAYYGLDKEFRGHGVVNHQKKEYSRGPISTNTIESYFAIMKRGLIGTYHHVGEQHLKRYLGEFDFKYNNRKVSDGERTENALRGIEGKRLMYRDSSRPT